MNFLENIFCGFETKSGGLRIKSGGLGIRAVKVLTFVTGLFSSIFKKMFLIFNLYRCFVSGFFVFLSFCCVVDLFTLLPGSPPVRPEMLDHCPPPRS